MLLIHTDLFLLTLWFYSLKVIYKVTSQECDTVSKNDFWFGTLKTFPYLSFAGLVCVSEFSGNIGHKSEYKIESCLF